MNPRGCKLSSDISQIDLPTAQQAQRVGPRHDAGYVLRLFRVQKQEVIPVTKFLDRHVDGFLRKVNF